MEITGIISLSIPLLSQNEHTSSTAVKPKSPASKAGQSVTHYKTLKAAVESILNDKIQVIAFGEIHKEDPSNLPSTLHHFSNEIMPLLAKHGIKNLVIAYLLSGEKAKNEIQAFGRTQQLGPFLKEWYEYHPNYCDIIEALKEAHASGITLHGCHVSGLDEYGANLTRMGDFINERALEILYPLLGQGKRTAVYTGAVHNDIKPIAGKENRNFGKMLRKKFGHGYIEVDIYLPDLIPKLEDKNLLSLEGWRSLIPNNGVNLVKFSNQRYVLILPASKDPIVPQTPERAPACP